MRDAEAAQKAVEACWEAELQADAEAARVAAFRALQAQKKRLADEEAARKKEKERENAERRARMKR